MSDVLRQVADLHFDTTDYGALVSLVRASLIAGAALGLVAGAVSVIVMMRDLPFAVHGISELSFAGAAGALLLGVNVVAGSLVGSLLAALVIGLLGVRARDRNSIIGVLMPFGLGLGVLFLSLYQGRAANKFGLLTGQIVAVDTPALGWLLGISAVVTLALLLCGGRWCSRASTPRWRPHGGFPCGRWLPSSPSSSGWRWRCRSRWSVRSSC